MSPTTVYLDHAATTPVREEVLEAMLPWFTNRFGNPSSTHRLGREARVALDDARERVAATLGAHPDEVCFTSGGTESDNFGVIGAWRASRAQGRTAVLSSPIEHKAVLAACHQVVREGGTECFVPVSAHGVVDVDAFAALCDETLAVASVMWVNNEVGVVQDLPALTSHAKAAGALMHTDAVQAFGKIAFDLRTLPVDLLSISGHKIGAPKGIGALFIRRGVTLEPLLHGGSQDRGRRPGTENLPYAVGFARACELAVAEREREVAHLAALRDQLEARLVHGLPDLIIHGRGAPRAPHVTNVSIPGTDAELLLMTLDLKGIQASGGSACQSGSVGHSHVLEAMGVPQELAASAMRLSVGALTDEAAIAHAAEVIVTVARKARGLVPA
jgi:cysteine desulfurase